jgi:hypothetical protein
MHVAWEFAAIIVLIAGLIVTCLLVCKVLLAKYTDEPFQLGEYDPNLYSSEIVRSP